MVKPPKKDLPDPAPAPKPNPGKDLPDPMPAAFKDDTAGKTATDERGGKAVRGWENIDEEGHDQSHGDDNDERDGQTGV